MLGLSRLILEFGSLPQQGGCERLWAQSHPCRCVQLHRQAWEQRQALGYAWFSQARSMPEFRLCEGTFKSRNKRV